MTRWSPRSRHRRREAGQHDAARAHAGRHHRPQRRDEAPQGRSDRAFGRCLRTVCRSRPGLGDPSPQLGRAAPRPRHLPRDGRCGLATRTTRNTSLGKAGRSRWLGRKPVNRGVTMNPVDHPHGGGEGRTSGGRHPVSPVGQADQGQEDPLQQGDGQVHRPLASSEEGPLSHDPFALEGPVRRRVHAEEGREGAGGPAATRSSRPGAAARPSCRSSSASPSASTTATSTCRSRSTKR